MKRPCIAENQIRDFFHAENIFSDFFTQRVAERLALVYNHPFSSVTSVADDSLVLPYRVPVVASATVS
ncbi:MAG TPA: hypothetical protein VIB39_18610 [Candidatus Angelobacter sp.]|jgi:hypothetical protein